MHELEEVAGYVRPLRTIWLAMIAGVVAFTVVVLFLIDRETVTPIPTLRAGAGATLAIILVIGLLGANYVRKIVEKTPPSATRGQVARKWSSGWLVAQAIKEGVGLAGLVLALLVGAGSWALAFGVASAASMIMTPPWEAELRHRLQHADPND